MNKLFSVFILSCLFSSLTAIEIKPLREITLAQSEAAFINKCGSFIVTEDGMVFVFDTKAAHIKVFNPKGELANIFGRKGVGPHEFVKPFGSSYKKPYIIFSDFGRKSIFIYKRKNREGLELAEKYLCLNMPYDFHLLDDGKLLVAGYKPDKNGKAYNVYKYDLKNNKYEFILSAEASYGFDSVKSYERALQDKLKYLGIFQFCDFTDDRIYLAWESDISIIKINRKTKAVSTFGKKTGNYFPPSLTPELKRAYDRRNDRLIYIVVEGMSFVTDIFVLNSDKIGLVYVGPLKNKKGMNVMLQIYKPNGEFVEEFVVLNAKATLHNELNFYFSRGKNLFYILDTETSEEFDQFHKIYEYRIEE
ncbi:MAG: hypothetical protein GY950_17820 [bacterium]|nr:hypothetical protein [bacterium]